MLRSSEAQEVRWGPSGESGGETPSALEVLDSFKIEAAILACAITYGGIDAWGWGTQSFHVVSEGWWGMNTNYAGLDKVGHFYNTYALSEFFYFRLREYNGGRRVATLVPAALGLSLMTYVEIADGFSETHGFSPEDFVMDFTGATLSALRNAVPEVGEALDVRFEYLPSKSVNGLHPFKDYSGQKFLAVLKPAGLPWVRDTPLRYLEFLAGYSARGFKLTDMPYYPLMTAEFFVGVGLSLEQLLFKRVEWHTGKPGHYLRTVSHYFQVPYTYVPVTVNKRQALPPLEVLRRRR